MDYAEYRAVDFATDDKFIAWVKCPDANLNAFWDAFLRSHEYKRAETERARHLILSVKSRQAEWSEERKANLKARILAAVSDKRNK